MTLPTRFLVNPSLEEEGVYPPELASILDRQGHERAFREIGSWPGYRPTPLVELPGLARALGLAELVYKDEGGRLGQGSFKALGGGYGVLQVLRRHLREKEGLDAVSSPVLLSGELGEFTDLVTVTCASAGNHGMSVAMGARHFGCRAVIFLPAHTTRHRVRAIEATGAQTEMVPGSYDDAVAVADGAARAEGWHLVSDTAYPGYEEIPREIMNGYTVLAREILEEREKLPTHVFLQGGVGGLAAAVTAHFWDALGSRRPVTAVVEPAAADCLLESALRGRVTPSRGSPSSSMECLACQNPSTLAWPILNRGAHAFLTVPDHAAEETVDLLARGSPGDPPLQTQPSGAAGLAGLIATSYEPTLSTALELDGESRVLVIGSEGPATP